MKILFANPPTLDNQKFIREGRCMQSVNSWAAISPPLTLAILDGGSDLFVHFSAIEGSGFKSLS